MCSKCMMRRWRSKNPLKSAYAQLKESARKRRKLFNITLPQFAEFLAGTDYLERAGKSAESLTIDRIKNHLGYEPGNLQILTNSENASKGNREDTPTTETDEDPF